MIHPVTCICLLMAAGSGLYVYQSKHQAQMLDREITRTMKSVDAARQRTGLMRAEYALLNDPSRLSELSSQNIASLKTSDSKQFTTWTDLDRRLGAVGAIVGAPPPADRLHLDLPEPAKIEPIAAPSASRVRPEPIVAPLRLEPPKSEPLPTRAAIATTTSPRPPVQPPVIAPAQATPPTPVPAIIASALPHAMPPSPTKPQMVATAAAPATALPAPIQLAPPPVVRSAPIAAPAPKSLPVITQAIAVAANTPVAPVQSTVAMRPARPAPTPTQAPVPNTPAEAIAQIARGVAVDASVPAVASALGMARAMMTAPSPVSQAYAAPVAYTSPQAPRR